MRIEPYGVGSLVHALKRGAKGIPIVRDLMDYERFIKSLYLLNDLHQDQNWCRDTRDLPPFERPSHWPERKPLVSILAWTLLPNHFHLLLQEIQEGGIAKFMQRLGGSMSLYFNAKYHEQGSIFQSSYKGKTVQKNSYLQYLVAYILVKNVFEMYPEGLVAASNQFDKAWEWASNQTFSSFGTSVRGEDSPILDQTLIADLGLFDLYFKERAKDMFYGHLYKRPDFASLMLEKWQ